MIDLNKLIETRKLKLQEIEAVLSTAKDEKREMFTTENEKFESINLEIKNIDTQIEEKQKNNIKINNRNNINMEKFSLLKAIRNVVEGRHQDEVSLAVLDAGKKGFADAGLSFRGNLTVPFEFEERAVIDATTNTAGEYAIGVQQFDMLGALRGNLVAVKAGATLMSGLVGDVSIPVYAGSTALWKSEVDSADEGAGAFTEITMSPKRLTFYIDISKQFLVQDSTNAESLLMRDLTEAIQSKLEATIFDDVVAGDGPAGLFYGASYTNCGTATFARVVALEGALATSNALINNLAYITHPNMVSVLKTTAKSTGNSGFLMDSNKEANGYKVFATSHMTKLGATGQTGTTHSGVIFANWADLLIGNWGNLDITVDPYTQAAKGTVRLVVNSYWDVARRRDASFKYASYDDTP